MEYALADINAGFGRTATGSMEFPGMQARLDHMDRLGIGFSVVWNIKSKRNNASSSNLRLLEEMEKTPAAKGRVMPALTVSGMMTYETDGIAALKRQMLAYKTRALRFANTESGQSLCQLEPVIRDIRELKPVLIMRHDETTPQDIMEFSALFPDVPIILTDVMFMHCMKVFELMRQRTNIMLDNSWLHSDGAIELVVKHFGAARLFFGTGYKTHNGASIASIARAEISGDDRRAIASGNLLDALGVERAVTVGLPSRLQNPGTLWDRYLSGHRLGVDIVDAHTHFGASARYVLENQSVETQLPRALRMLDRMGGGTMISVCQQAIWGDPIVGNRFFAAYLEKHADRIKGYLAFNPHYASELSALLDEYFASGLFVGFKIVCSHWNVPIGDRRFVPMLDYANRHRMPILSHVWGIDDVRSYRDVLGRYPDATFIFGHAGGTDDGRDEADGMAVENPNLFLETCGTFCSTRPWEETVKKVNARQIIYGTDAMMHDMSYELGRILSLDLPDDTLIPILGQNMRGILAQRR